MTECRRASPRSGPGMRVPKPPIAPKGWAGSSPAGAIDAIGANGTGVGSAAAGATDAAAFYRQAANAALVALAALDPDHERAEVPAVLPVEARSAFGPSIIAPERHRKAMAGLLHGFAAHARPSGEGAPS